MQDRIFPKRQRDKRNSGKIALFLTITLIAGMFFTGCEMPVPLNQRLLIRGIGIDWENGEYFASLQAGSSE